MDKCASGSWGEQQRGDSLPTDEPDTKGREGVIIISGNDGDKKIPPTPPLIPVCDDRGRGGGRACIVMCVCVSCACMKTTFASPMRDQALSPKRHVTY